MLGISGMASGFGCPIQVLKVLLAYVTKFCTVGVARRRSRPCSAWPAGSDLKLEVWDLGLGLSFRVWGLGLAWALHPGFL